MTNRLYTQREVSKIFSDVPNKTLIYWARQGLVEWVAETRDARGIARLYSYWNLFQIGFVRELAGIGFSIESIREIMNNNFKDFRIEKKYVIDDKGEEVEESLPSEFHYSGFRPEYFIVLKGAWERGFGKTKTIMTAFSNFTKDDPFQLNFGHFDKNRDDYDQKPKANDMSITATIIINLAAVKLHVNNSIEKANLD